ncbi:MAG: carbamoyltransferase [Bacteroidales bacterium]|nr:carbamoyltransferase [Bacteroidales bacterium]
MPQAILGISAYYHDSAAAIIVDGKIVAAAQEERFTRKKHDASFPANAARYVLDEAGIPMQSLAAIAFYDKPFLKFERLLETYHAFAPKGLGSFLSAIPVWIKEKIFSKKMLHEELAKLGLPASVPLLFPEHHLSHAASAFYPSPFEEAAILTLDGVGEWATLSICKGKGNSIEILKELHFPHSVGLLYSAFTYYTGFRVNSGEYKLMGLAPYGNKNDEQTNRFISIIKDKLVDIREDGSILLNMQYFKYATGLRMTYDKKWEALFGIPARKADSPITQDYMNMAMAIQRVTEEIVIKLAKTARALTGCKNLTMAGGVALNSVANGILLQQKIFDQIWIQPAAGDAGGALGAALAAWHIWKQQPRATEAGDTMQGAYLGPAFNKKDIEKTILQFNANAHFFSDFEELAKHVAGLIAGGKVVGWFQGRMEYGPRALGGRSILADARNPEMQKKLNLKIKYREGFRPFAPSVLEESSHEYFMLNEASPYMLVVVPVVDARCFTLPSSYEKLPLLDKLYFKRSDLPAITHVDYSARVQTVNKKVSPRYWALINSFKELTGYGAIINTSFNVRGEPIVCTPNDAFRCFMNTEMDVLVMEHFLFLKEDQLNVQNLVINKGAKGED